MSEMQAVGNTEPNLFASPKNIAIAITVASLGYFVDIYDLILFTIVRIPSLTELNLSGSALLESGLMLLNLQMLGMLVGGIFFGVLGDKVGRLSVLFGSILIYSIANLLNAYVVDLNQYAILRFIAGVGLAGELGAGVTLIAEIMPKEKRGWGTTLIAAVGGAGALWAWFVADHLSWRHAYVVGGVMGFLLLIMRWGVRESGMFSKAKTHEHIRRGDFLSLFLNKKRFVKLMACVSIGVPIWYVIGILVTLSPEFARLLHVQEEIGAGRAVFFCYSGLIIGDLISGILSQKLRSRKKSVLLFLISIVIAVIAFFGLRGLSAADFYGLCLFLGIATGYWAMFVTIAAEQFGTNIRATVTTVTPNFVRGSLVPVSFIFTSLKERIGMLESGFTVGMITLLIAFWGYWKITESFHSDLDYFEPL